MFEVCKEGSNRRNRPTSQPTTLSPLEFSLGRLQRSPIPAVFVNSPMMFQSITASYRTPKLEGIFSFFYPNMSKSAFDTNDVINVYHNDRKSW